MKLAKLRKLLKLAKSPKRRKQLLQLIHVAELSSSSVPKQMTRELADRVIAGVAEDRPAIYFEELLDNHRQRVLRWTKAKAIQARRESRRDAFREMWRQLNPIQKRAMFGLAYDSTGLPKPPPVAVGPLNMQEPTEAEVFEHISPLLVVDGDKTEQRVSGTEGLVLRAIEAAKPVARLAAGLVLVRLVDRTHAKAQRIVRDAIQSVGENIQQWFRDRILAPIGLRKPKPEVNRYPDFVGRDGGTVVTEQRGAGEVDIRDELGGIVYVGYTLYSAFAENTRPQHAFRDSQKFYIDDREGSAKPWADRIQPPYYYDDENAEVGLHIGGNCLCFTVPILETPEGDEYSAEFGIRNSGGVQVTARDVGSLRSWFNQQSPGVRRATVGPSRWDARNDQDAQFEDFYHPSGDPLTEAELRGEDATGRRRRTDRTVAVMEAQRRRHVEAWEEWGYANRFDGDLAREAAYLRKLQRFMSRLR